MWSKVRQTDRQLERTSWILIRYPVRILADHIPILLYWSPVPCDVYPLVGVICSP